DDASALADLRPGDEAVEAASGAEVDDDFTGLERRDGGRVAAGQAEVGFVGRAGEVAVVVADGPGELIGAEGGRAAAAARGRAAGRGAVGGCDGVLHRRPAAAGGDRGVAGADLV